MKKLFCLLLLVVILSACGAGKDQTVQTGSVDIADTASDSGDLLDTGERVQATDSANSVESKEETKEPPEADHREYTEILDLYYQALSENWSAGVFWEHEMSPLSVYCYEGDALKNVGYAFLDVNEDENDELLIGSISGDDFVEKMIFELYTIENNEVRQVFAGSERDRYYICKKETGDYSFVNSGSGGAMSTILRFCDLNGSKLKIGSGICMEYEWYKMDDASKDISEGILIAEDEALELIDDIETQYMQIDMMPFSSYIKNL